MTVTEIATLLYNWGHFSNPKYPDTHEVKESDLANLDWDDEVLIQAIMSYQDFMAEQLEPLSYAYHGRPAIHDGGMGPATEKLMSIPRCGAPDYVKGFQAVGTGNWPKCHGIGDFHAAIVSWDTSGMPSFLKPLFDKVWANVVASYEELGLRWIRDDGNRDANIEATFVRSSSGWIGLAIIGQNQSCSDSIWCRYLASYRGGNSEESIINQWSTLIKHELGHNCGLQHSRGGVMNPSIIPGLPISWRGDPSESLLNRWFGGEPIKPEPGPEPEPEPPKPDPNVNVTATGTIEVTIPPGTTPGVYPFTLKSESKDDFDWKTA